MHHAPYHEQFWVVAGTAAPVIALSLTVIITGLARSKAVNAPVSWRTATWPVFWFAITSADFIAMGYLTFVSLMSLAHGADRMSPTTVAVLAFLGVIAVWFVAVSNTITPKEESEEPSS